MCAVAVATLSGPRDDVAHGRRGDGAVQARDILQSCIAWLDSKVYNNGMGKLLYRECPQCGTSFTTYPSVNQKFCSKACSDQAVTWPLRYCVTCKRQLSIHCMGDLCRSCRGKARAVLAEATCLQCKRTFATRAWRKAQGKAKFCSRPCVNEYQKTLTGTQSFRWNGGKDRRRGVGWKIARQWALVRANERCEHCGKPRQPHDLGIHHIKPYQFCKTDAEANSPGNLIALCRSCHSKVHRLGEVIHSENGRFTKGKREYRGKLPIQK